MIVLASLQILLRGPLGWGIAWADPLLRVLVLWLGLFGAVTASREGRQISIDVLSRLFSGRPRAAVGMVTSLFTAGVAAVVAYHGARFVASEREFAGVAFSGIPAWAIESVIPVAFLAIALRYLGHAALDLLALVHGGEDGDASGQETGAP
ncbi:MAG: TRAP transporter small permease [Deltaproteobacteria bacterium]|nr:TRAP transporter small permease [Deltaproteobacteria bacterium]MBW2361934.1 TRAP transporter small permease [Deltaproteobacteria bacterium]